MRYNNIYIYAHLYVVSTVLAMVYVRHASHYRHDNRMEGILCTVS